MVDWTRQRHLAADPDSAHPLSHQTQQGRKICRQDGCAFKSIHIHAVFSRAKFDVNVSPAVKDKEDKEVDSEARPMKDETFGEYR